MSESTYLSSEGASAGTVLKQPSCGEGLRHDWRLAVLTVPFDGSPMFATTRNAGSREPFTSASVRVTWAKAWVTLPSDAWMQCLTGTGLAGGGNVTMQV